MSTQALLVEATEGGGEDNSPPGRAPPPLSAQVRVANMRILTQPRASSNSQKEFSEMSKISR